MANVSETVSEIQALRAEVALLRDELERSRSDAVRPPQLSSLAIEAEPPPAQTIEVSPRHRRTRRALFRTGAAAAAAVAATPLLTSRAAAADGDAFVVGQTNTSSSGVSRLNATGSATIEGGNVFTAADGGTSSLRPAAMGAFAFGNRVRNGLYAFVGARDDADVDSGHGVIIRALIGARSHLRLEPMNDDPRSDSYLHGVGSFRCDSNGDLWFCATAGTPGTWRKLAGPGTAGSFHAISPVRVHDSRLPPFSGLSGGQSFTFSVADGRDVGTGAVTTPDVVPPGATSISFNLTIAGTTGSGFMAVTPGGSANFSASTINWVASGSTMANGSVVAINNREVTVFVGGGFTHFILDVTGYTL